jgi:hypothetical protein
MTNPFREQMFDAVFSEFKKRVEAEWQEDAASKPPFRVLLRVQEKVRPFAFYVCDPLTGWDQCVHVGRRWPEASKRVRAHVGYPQVTP